MTLTISSRQNPWFKRLRDALREHREEIALEGPKQVDDALAAGWKPIVLVHRTEAPGRRSEEIVFSAELFDQISETRSPQNVMGLFARPHATLADALKRRDTIAVALDGVQDPGNVGTIIRLAAAFDCSGVILLPGCADAFSPKSIRASTGAVLTVPVATASREELIAANVPLVVADAAGQDVPPPSARAVIVFGSEGSGASEAIRRVATPISIAMSSDVESLNVAAAAAILLSLSFVTRGSPA